MINFVSQRFLEGDIPSYPYTVIHTDSDNQRHETSVKGYDVNEAHANFRKANKTDSIYDIVESDE